MYCNHCGKSLGENLNFCTTCGKKIKQIETESPTFHTDSSVTATVNNPIDYKFPYVWNKENMSSSPKVNLLLKALIERNYTKATELLNKGASFKKIHSETFRRCLFEFLEDYDLIKFMIDHGFTGLYFHEYPSISSTENYECIDRPGYGWSLTGRAFMLGKRNVLELLLKNRFKPGQFWKNGDTYDIPRYAMRTDHITLIDILLSHGYPSEKLLQQIPTGKHAESKACCYLLSCPDIKWKSYGQGCLEKDIEIPEEPEFSVFMFKKTKEKLIVDYNRRLSNYYLEIQAKEKYIKLLPEIEIKRYFKSITVDPALEKAMQAEIDEILEEGRKKALKKAEEQIQARKHSTSNAYTSTAVSHQTNSYKSYEEDMRETKIRQFSFVDAQGNYRRWGDTFVDCKGNYVRWGGTFVDGAGNYVKWGNSFVDGSGSYRNWGDNFIDGAGNHVRVP